MVWWQALWEHLDDYFRRRAVIYALVVALLGAGLTAGALAVGQLSEADHGELSSFLKEYVRRAESPGQRNLPREKEDGVLVNVARGAVVPWLLGLTIIGAPLALVLVFLRGFAVGFTLKFLVDELSFRGALLGLLSVAPHSLLTVSGLCLASGAALTFALSAAKVLAGRGDREGVLGHFAASTLLSAAAASMIAGGTWIQAHVTPVLVELAANWITF